MLEVWRLFERERVQGWEGEGSPLWLSAPDQYMFAYDLDFSSHALGQLLLPTIPLFF